MEGTRAGCWWWQWVCVICRRAGFHSLHSSTMRRLDSDQGDNFSHVFNHNHLMLSLGLLSRTLKRAGLSLNLSIIEVRSTFLIVIKRAQNTAPLTTSSTKFHLMMMAQPADQVLPLNKTKVICANSKLEKNWGLGEVAWETVLRVWKRTRMSRLMTHRQTDRQTCEVSAIILWKKELAITLLTFATATRYSTRYSDFFQLLDSK